MTGLRILVVDDEPQIIRFLKPALGAAGYDVRDRRNCRRGRCGWRRHSPPTPSFWILGFPTGTARR